MVKLSLENIGKSYDGDNYVLKNISFELEEGESLAVIGNSGGGKSTLLRLIAGYEYPSEGEILKDNKLISNHTKCLAPGKRKIGMIFQDYALFPHFTVDQNIRYGYSKSPESKYSIEELYKLTKLGAFKDRYPHQLSGGEQQRVAIARSMAASPDILLMDEPFSNIDVGSREEVRLEIRDLLKKSRITSIIVTHDYRDAMALSKHVLILNKGRLEQDGMLKEVYKRPASIFAARLFGSCNLLKIKEQDEEISTAFGALKVNSNYNMVEGGILVRPEDLSLSNSNSALVGKVVNVDYYGSVYRYTLESDEEILLMDMNSDEFEIGSTVHFELC